MKTDLRTAWLYLLAFLPTALLALVGTMLSIRIANAVLPRFGPEWVGILLNVIPSIAVGSAVYAVIAGARSHTMNSRSHHLLRTTPLYLLAIGLIGVLVFGWRDPAFGLYAQIFVSPCGVAIAGLLMDAFSGRNRKTPTPARAV